MTKDADRGQGLPEIMTVKETADYLRVSSSLVEKLGGAGKLPRIKIGNRVLFQRKALDAWLEQQVQKVEG